MRVENKKLVEAQNFNIKQPQLSGDVFEANNFREKSRPLNGAYILDTIIEDDHNIRSTEGGREGSPAIKKNHSVMQFSQLSFKDKMMDHRKTNFPMGNQFSNEFGSRTSKLQIESMYKTIDVGGFNKGPGSPIVSSGKFGNLEAAQNALLSTSNYAMTPQHGFRTKPGFDRPTTSIENLATVSRL